MGGLGVGGVERGNLAMAEELAGSLGGPGSDGTAAENARSAMRVKGRAPRGNWRLGGRGAREKLGPAGEGGRSRRGRGGGGEGGREGTTGKGGGRGAGRGRG